MILVSACLAGIKCNWKGEAAPCAKVIALVKNGEAIPVCPEQLGGLTTPRLPAEQKDGQVINRNGEYVTKEFKCGAAEVLDIARLYNCKKAILKARSPSCGCGEVYDGSFSHKLIPGDGVLTALLKSSGVEVITDEDIEEFVACE